MKKHKCPYCEYSFTRDELVKHIEMEHDEQIEGSDKSPSQIVFNIVNNKTHGTCVVCKKPTKWNESAGKYNRLCDNPKCREHLRKLAQENMIRVHHMTSKEMLNNPEHQAKMLANRSISGTYKFRDGGVRSFTGSFERKALEFFDKVLEVPSNDIMTPGPTFAYQYNGERHVWITDIYYIPHNLVIEVKDGGDNPNNRSMKSYREKQIAKEQMITNLGTYNYLRLTNNNFSQLMSIMAELKAQALDDSKENKDAIIRINESVKEVGGIPPANSNDVYVIAYGYDNYAKTFGGEIEGFAMAGDIISDNLIAVKNGKLIKAKMDKFLENRRFNIYKFKGDKYKEIVESLNTATNISEGYIYETLSGKKMYSKDQIDFDPLFEEVNIDAIGFGESAISDEVENFMKTRGCLMPIIKPEEVSVKENMLLGYNNLDILESVNGYVVKNISTGQLSPTQESITDIGSNILDMMTTAKYYNKNE